ncbi:helix-turn-helix domain-containing protein [Actinosynnema sp. CA-248983]
MTLGARLRALRAASGRTVAAVAADAGLSVPYVANLENDRGNPTVDALSRLATALGTTLDVDLGPSPAPPELPPSLVRLGRGTRFRRDVGTLADHTGTPPDELAAAVLDVLARMGGLAGREPTERDWHRLLDALLLVTAHPSDR